jgi:putative hydrolase
MLRVDFHSHSIASVHALNTIEEMLRYADEHALEAIAITDHCPGIDNTQWLLQHRTDSDCWKERISGPDVPYFLTFLSRYRPPSSIKTRLFKGIECNILSHSKEATDLPSFIAHRFDVVIASVHPLPSLFEVEDREQITRCMIAAMDAPIDIIGHPSQRRYCPLMEPLVKAAADKGVVLELNNASLKLGKADIEQTIQMLTLAARLDCRIALSSDAHAANELGEDNEIGNLLKQTGFPPELIVNGTLAAAETFVEHRRQVRRQKTQPNSA